MTSGKSFWVNFIKNNTQRLWMWIVSCLSFIVFYPALLIAYFNRISYSYGEQISPVNRAQYIKEMQEAVCDALGYNSCRLHFVIAGIIGIGIFVYLNNKSKMDMLKSIPVSTKKMYITDYVNGLMIYAVPYLLNLIITIIIAAFSGYLTGLAIGEMFVATFINFILFILYYSLAVVCVCITGNLFISVCAYLACSFSLVALIDSVDSLASRFYKTMDWEFKASTNYFSPIYDYANMEVNLKAVNSISEELHLLGAKLVLWIIFAIALAVIAYIAYMRRPAEALNKVCYSAKIRLAVKLFFGFVATIGVARMVFNSFGESRSLMVISIIAAGLIVGMAFEGIFATDIKAVLKSFWSTGLIVAAGLCVFLVMQFDLTGYDKYVPTSSKIKSYAIDLSPNIYMDTYRFDKSADGKISTSYMNNTDYYKEYMIIENVEAIEKLAQKCLDNKLYLLTDENNITSYSVYYRNKLFGGTSRRVYVDLDDEESKALINEIVSTRAWKESYFHILREKDELSKMNLKITYKDGVHGFKISNSVAEIIDAYDKDLENFNYYVGSEDRPVGMIYIDFDMGSCLNLPVYENYSNILQIARQCDGYTDEPIAAADVDSIRVTNYHSEYWDNNDSVTYDYSPEVTITVTDQSKIKDILDYSKPTILSKFWDRYDPRLGNYSVEVFLKNDTGEIRRGEFVSMSFTLDVPAWLEEETKIRPIMKGDIKMSSYKDYKEKALNNPDVKAEYDALGPEYDLIQAMIDARNKQNITQKELSEITGITQADISRIENGTRNPSLAMVKRIAAGLGMQLRLEFVPTTVKH